MSSLIFHFAPEQVIIATDTLATTTDTKEPLFFSTKVYPLPHLNGVMCCTGVATVGLEWFTHLARFIVRDFHHLDQFVTPALIELASQYDLDDDLTATVYHFGYSEAEGALCRVCLPIDQWLRIGAARVWTRHEAADR
jgi:hypothetical protein